MTAITMAKISCVLDKSVFQRIADEHASVRSKIWTELHHRCQIVLPLVLIEEVIVNVANPGTKPVRLVEEMAEKAMQLLPCWMEDAFEMAYQELIRGRKFEKLPAPSEEMISFLKTLKKGEALSTWAKERKLLKKQTALQRIQGQNQLIDPDQFRSVNSTTEFFGRFLPIFNGILQKDSSRLEMLETILGEPFRARHPEASDDISNGLREFTAQTFTNFPITLNCITVRLLYMYAPLVKIAQPGEEPREILGRELWNQLNNPEDEQYVVSSMLCQRLLTADRGMKNMMEILVEVGLTKCETIFVERNSPLLEQIQNKLL